MSIKRASFVYLCLPILGQVPPKGPGWAHQPKWDGYRLLVAKDRDTIRLFSKGGTDWTERLSGFADAFLELPTLSAVLDGELCICDGRGRPDFRALHAEMRQSRPDVSRMAFFAFDLLSQDKVDLCRLSFTERQKDLKRLCADRRVPCLYLVESFPEGESLLEWCANYGLEGIVSKRRASGYVSGPWRHWVKTKCPNWRRENSERHLLFDNKKPEPGERERKLMKKREELARVQERLEAPDVRPGMARELRKRVGVLEAEIAELSRNGGINDA